MDYLYENLGDERFQELCSTILSKEFTDMQSLPVGQPDGGRDAIGYYMDSRYKSFNVFQVKFVRNPNNIENPHKWLYETLKGEISKIQKLIPKGAVKYYLLTNVKGTSHLDTGSIDKTNKLLEDNISIPSICWWRDDISRMIEKDPIFKWSFPELLNGQDVINSILFNHINENREKREGIVKAYLADQYSIDNEVKFRQIDLRNKLFDLFTDVPIRIKKIGERNKSLRRTLQHFEPNFIRKVVSHHDYFYFDEPEHIGAAAFLLHSKTQNEIERILLEGGPGQGKSTISQYVSQVHRARLLNRVNDLLLIPENLLNTPIRLPFKIDLRDIALWVENKNPYQAEINETFFNSIWKNSLESFMVAHIIYHSKVSEFNSVDLLAIVKLSSILFVFDGFDEIANLSVRKEVVELINKGINRMSENAKSLQVLVTSRPAAFNDAVSFETDLYPHFELTNITPKIIEEYVGKWIKASKLDSREANEIKKLVKEKLELPHLKELAKSPMQLAIFISLLKTRGESLPNKRTTLYDSYIELFFNRESEKNLTIRQHRDLIIDIHQYLAWVLHSEAEFLKNSGRIAIDDLKDRLKKYLSEEEHDTEIADILFDVVKERVCALVSRVQGTFEFEVQPLREYFCARYLYNTSPYSPVGKEKSGTKPERFDAIARSFYWQNVVRFFAGCFDKGELPMLIERLKELQDDEQLKFTNYPRVLTAQILADYVFTQYPSLLKSVVKIIVEGIGNLINDAKASSLDYIVLPDNSGRLELVTECFEQLKIFPKKDYAIQLINIINSNPLKKQEFWIKELKNYSGNVLTTWFEYAYLLQIVHRIDLSTIEYLLNESQDLDTKYKRLQILINGNNFDIIDNNIEVKKNVLTGILDGKIFISEKKSNSSLFFLSSILNPYNLIGIFQSNGNLPFKIYLNRHNNVRIQNKDSEFVVDDEIDEVIYKIYKKIEIALNSNVSDFTNGIELWDLIFQSIIDIYGNRWNFYGIATIAAGIKSKVDVGEEFSELHNENISLAKRVRYARLKSGNLKFWTKTLEENDLKISLLVFFYWATPRTISLLSQKVSDLILKLSEKDYEDICTALSMSNNDVTVNSAEYLQELLKRNDLTNELKFLIAYRFSQDKRQRLVNQYINLESKYLINFKSDIMDSLINQFFGKPSLEILSKIRDLYTSEIDISNRYVVNRYYYYEDKKIPLDMAKTVMQEPKNFPRIIAISSEKTCRLHANKNVKYVGEIAKKNKWFIN